VVDGEIKEVDSLRDPKHGTGWLWIHAATSRRSSPTRITGEVFAVESSSERKTGQNPERPWA